jgi:hypothetical protein
MAALMAFRRRQWFYFCPLNTIIVRAIGAIQPIVTYERVQISVHKRLVLSTQACKQAVIGQPRVFGDILQADLGNRVLVASVCVMGTPG